MTRFLPVVCLLLTPGFAVADVWDIQTQNDNSSATENELVHGSDQFHDLGALAGPAADNDYYKLRQLPYSSYEIVADATSGDIGQTLRLERLVDGGTTIDSSVAVGLGYARSLRIRNTGAGNDDNDLIRVVSGAGNCTTNCGTDDVYRIRAYETTYSIPRFNNTGTQGTVLQLQNPTPVSVDVSIYFWSEAGALLATQTQTIASHGLYVLNTAPVTGAVAGSITISNTAPYGRLSGKAVAVQVLSATSGYIFETPMVPIPH